jgi:hypothetical protein
VSAQRRILILLSNACFDSSAMTGYLIYHPKRTVSKFTNVTVHHDETSGNQDPYVWNRRFLHTYCHMSQMSPAVGEVNFWVSGAAFPNFSQLFCDLVFLTERKEYWRQANLIDRADPIVDTEEAYIDHYRWAFEHPFRSRRRFTLKAHATLSFQPQTTSGSLIDIIPFLERAGLSVEALRHGLKAGFNSRPMPIGRLASMLYEWLDRQANVKVLGSKLEEIRRCNLELASAWRPEYL